jgi:hypothetical protein
MTVKFPARVSKLVLSYFLHSVLYYVVVPIFAEPAVEYLTLIKTCFKTEGRRLRIAGRICLLEQDLDVMEWMLLVYHKRLWEN